jgi:hypothetical protein
MNLRIALIALLIALSGCVTVEPLPDDQASPQPMPELISDRFRYESKPVDTQMILVDETRHYLRYDGSFQPEIAGEEDGSPVTFEYYRQPENESAPVILVLPILHGKKYVARPFAKYFAKHGYAAVIVDTAQRNTLPEDLIDPETAIRQTVIRHRLMLDWVTARPELDANRIAIFGASLGGFNALYVAGVDDRVRAVVSGLAAGDLPYVFVNSNERQVKRSVDLAMDQLEMDRGSMFDYLNEKLETDTMTIAPHIASDRVMMVLARFDTAVPYEKQLELWEALGSPEAITLPTGHISAALYILYLRKQALGFFNRKLAQPRTDRRSQSSRTEG